MSQWVPDWTGASASVKGTVVLPTREELERVGCWFDADRAVGAEMTAFKREARWRQHQWAVEVLGITSFGTHPGRSRNAAGTRLLTPNGTKLNVGDADNGKNFLTPAIHAIAMARAAPDNFEPHQTLDVTRLRRDLLSSMPMAFNLFGEASLPNNADARARLATLFGVGVGDPSEIVFEWSPARRDPAYTRDRTAFDVALRIGDPTGPRTVVGIETKYHEHSTNDHFPRATDPVARRRFREQTDFLVALSVRSAVFRAGWQDRVLETDLRQIWRDHLLALSMRDHSQLWTSDTRYVLIHPERNVSFRAATQAYASLLTDGDTSFRALTLETVVDAAFATASATQAAFIRRYLW